MIIKDWKKEVFTIPNFLSLFRLLLIPVYVAIYLNATERSDYYIAAAILAVSCLTDLIDGQIARRFNMISTVGKILDPLADKLTQFTLIICLAVKYPILRVIVALFFVKEIFQLVAGIVNYRKGRMLKGALLSGKICTAFLFISLIIMVMFPNLNHTVVIILSVLSGILLLIAFISYVLTYFTRDSKFQKVDKQ